MTDSDLLAEFLALQDIKRDFLVVLARQGPLKIKRTLDERLETEINRSRLYPNLNELAEAGLIEKGQLTQRANRYEITDRGKRAVESYQQWISDENSKPTPTTTSPRPLQRLSITQLDAPDDDS